ncbi:MAG TPA: transcriptional regulator [Succinivibrionaceae bacterium]|nr:transcriptional regulator [Succinivibrionaceae bacterium]
MDDWNKYQNRIKTTKPSLRKDLEEIEEISEIVGTIIKQRHELYLSQREIADLCGLPQSSIARIESGKTYPNLSTLRKILRKLGLRFSINSVPNTVRY